MIKRTLSFIVFFLVVFVVYLLFNTLTFNSKQISYPSVQKIEISDSAIHHLSEAIKIKTISTEDPKDFDSLQFIMFSDYLASTYQVVEKKLTKNIINEFSYLYKWQGSNAQLKPIILAAHSDVVPVPKEDLKNWTVPPFFWWNSGWKIMG